MIRGQLWCIEKGHLTPIGGYIKMKCSFCGYEFNETNTAGCKSCPLQANCGKIKCPHCGFEMPQENLLWKWFRRRRRGAGAGRRHGQRKKVYTDALPLSQLEAGKEAVVCYIDTGNKSTLNKIMALGILPGVRVTMIQKFPTFVFQVGNTRVTADEQLVNTIMVQKD
jgi:Fe2+ transport system protein FeoA/rubredoxin